MYIPDKARTRAPMGVATPVYVLCHLEDGAEQPLYIVVNIAVAKPLRHRWKMRSGSCIVGEGVLEKGKRLGLNDSLGCPFSQGQHPMQLLGQFDLHNKEPVFDLACDHYLFLVGEIIPRPPHYIVMASEAYKVSVWFNTQGDLQWQYYNLLFWHQCLKSCSGLGLLMWQVPLTPFIHGHE